MSSPCRSLIWIALLTAGCSKAPPAPAETVSTSAPAPKQKATAAAPASDTFTARIMKVIDGDTVKVVDRDFRSLVVQLNGVDAPELAQEFGPEARDALAKRLDEKVVRIVVSKRDELDRIAGEVFERDADDTSINVWIIRQGFGWYNHKYDSDEAKSVAETEARGEALGLWSSDKPVPPWVWKNPPDDGRLYTQGKGTRYHRGSCETLDGRRKPISLDEAILNYKPCQRCKPPEK